MYYVNSFLYDLTKKDKHCIKFTFSSDYDIQTNEDYEIQTNQDYDIQKIKLLKLVMKKNMLKTFDWFAVSNSRNSRSRIFTSTVNQSVL